MTSVPVFLLNLSIDTQIYFEKFRQIGFPKDPELVEWVLPFVIDTVPRPSDCMQGM